MRLIQQSSKYLKKAQESFKKGEYSECLEFCSLASGILSEIQDNPNFVAKNKPFLQMLTMLADMALDHKDEATSLFDYYQIIKDSKTSDAQQEIIAMIENFDKNLIKQCFKQFCILRSISRITNFVSVNISSQCFSD